MNSDPSNLRRLLDRPGIIRSLGAHDIFTAILLEDIGFEVVFLGGFGVSASLLGMPDLDFLSMPQMAERITRMTSRISRPMIADGDTGHGNVRETVRAFEAAGAAGILIEDQISPKRCGHFGEKQVVDLNEMKIRIMDALEARSNPDFLILARTDARQQKGLEEAIQRAQICQKIGADITFIEAPQSRQELEEIASRVEGPLLANMLTGGVTPILSADELQSLGYKIVVCPVESLMVTAQAIRHLGKTFLSEGRVDHLISTFNFEDLKEILEVKQHLSSRSSLKK